MTTTCVMEGPSVRAGAVVKHREEGNKVIFPAGRNEYIQTNHCSSSSNSNNNNSGRGNSEIFRNKNSNGGVLPSMHRASEQKAKGAATKQASSRGTAAASAAEKPTTEPYNSAKNAVDKEEIEETILHHRSQQQSLSAVAAAAPVADDVPTPTMSNCDVKSLPSNLELPGTPFQHGSNKGCNNNRNNDNESPHQHSAGDAVNGNKLKGKNDDESTLSLQTYSKSAPRREARFSPDTDPIILSRPLLCLRSEKRRLGWVDRPVLAVQRLIGSKIGFLWALFCRNIFEAAGTPRLASANHRAHPSQRSRRGCCGAYVRGIPNYGQTCFLNSVLQSLASLRTFVAYLEQCATMNKLLNHSNQSSPSSSLTQALLTVLEAVNGGGGNGSDKIDPRPVLQAVGQVHGQFRAKYAVIGKEQQDAQELLQAVLGMIIKDVHLEAASSCSSKRPFSGTSRTVLSALADEGDDDDEVLTVVSGCKERARQKRHQQEQGKQQQEQEQELLGYTVVGQGGETNGNDTNMFESASTLGMSLIIPRAGGSVAKPADGTSIAAKSPGNGAHHRDANGVNGHPKPPKGEVLFAPTDLGGNTVLHQQQEEKKQEDVEQVDSNLSAIQNGNSSRSSSGEAKDSSSGKNKQQVGSEVAQFPNRIPLDSVGKCGGFTNRTLDDESLSDVSSTKERQLTTAMQMMRTTTSSINPSPLSGWLGSALRCRKCGHVRPIQNTPFSDLPVVPTSVSGYLHVKNHGAGEPPRKYEPSGDGPPCTLEECLEEFTKVERVQDVECRNCTLRAEMDEQRENMCMYRNAVESGLARARRNGERGDDDVKHSREEQARAESRYAALSRTCPDDGDDASFLRLLSFAGEGSEPTVTLKRSSAYKRLLLTRLPSVLCIHVQRRFYDPATNRMSKTTQRVEFPEELDVAPYCAYSGSGYTEDRQWGGTNGSRQQELCEAPNSRRIYKLMSAIEHRGNAFSGHYVCFRRDPSCGSKWLFTSDDCVKRVDWSDVRECQAYMLFYEAL